MRLILILVMLWGCGTLVAQQPTPATSNPQQAQASARAQGQSEAHASATGQSEARASATGQVPNAAPSRLRARTQIQTDRGTSYRSAPAPVWLIRKRWLGWGYRAQPGWLHPSLGGQTTQESVSIQQHIVVPPSIQFRAYQFITR